MSCMEYMYHTCILKFFFVAWSYVHTPSSQALSKPSIRGSMYTLILFPEYPWIINDTNMYCRWKVMSEGKLRGITNTGQQVCGAAVIPKGLNLSVAGATRTLRASRALSPWIPSKWVHASTSDGCVNLSLYRDPFCAKSFASQISWSCKSVGSAVWARGTVGHLLGSWVASFYPHQSLCPRIKTFLHFRQCVAFSCSFLNKTHPFGQACICSYDI
jgi:hypothetical protein